MNLNDLARYIYADNCAKAWYDQPDRQPLESHMLIVTEVAEASEEVRNHRPFAYQANGKTLGEIGYADFILSSSLGVKPEGEAVELADAMIRILDYMAHRGWDIDSIVEAKLAYNRTRAYRHGGKKL